jgi:ABC-type Fe3+/spermidine/putrescine transport system ATPase subunit
VLFDEPLSNLDAKLRDQVRREIRSLQQELGFTTIYVTHDQAEALAMSDQVVVMRGGRIDQIGAPEDVYQRPDTAFVADFIGAANLLPFERNGPGTVATALGELRVTDEPSPDMRYLCWRPEDARIAGAGTDNLIRAAVRERAFQGAYTEMHVQVGRAPDQRLHVPGGTPLTDGEIEFRLPPEKIRFVRGTPE